MKARSTILLAASLCICLASCATNPPEKSDKDKEKTPEVVPRLVGRVASIPADKRYVLIQSYGKWNIEIDQILTTRGPNDRMANLRTSGESLGEFAAAELQSGQLEVGDAVYFKPKAKPSSLSELSELPQNQNHSANKVSP